MRRHAIISERLPALTAHRMRVCARQRGIPEWVVGLVIRYGRRLYARGAFHYFFGHRDGRCLSAQLRPVVERLQDIVVVVEDGCIVTVYHNPQALKDLRRRRSKPRERLAA